MNFNNHYDLEGKHAFLGASQYAWLNYDQEKLYKIWLAKKAVERGDKLHKLARQMIELKEGFGGRSKMTLRRYVDDAIGFNMCPEKVIMYSNYSYGTADSISFNNGLLRIHDLKTGVTPASMKQLQIYAAYFCLEYNIKPSDIEIQTRIYQGDQIQSMQQTAAEIVPIMDKAKAFNKFIEEWENGGY